MAPGGHRGVYVLGETLQATTMQREVDGLLLMGACRTSVAGSRSQVAGAGTGGATAISVDDAEGIVIMVNPRSP